MCEYFKCTDFNSVIEDNDHEYLTSTANYIPLLKSEIILKFLSSERLYLNSTRICRNAII